jgi:hypothetical protein
MPLSMTPSQLSSMLLQISSDGLTVLWQVGAPETHAIVPAAHTPRAPGTEQEPAAATPHAPQFLGSVLVFTHEPEQYLVPVGHVEMHDPEEQAEPAGHTCPHQPQLRLSLNRSISHPST